MLGTVPPSAAGQPDMFPSQAPQAPAADLFHGQPTAHAPDMFPKQTPDAPTADMFDNASKTANPSNQDVFPSRAPQTPPYPLYHNPNASGP